MPVRDGATVALLRDSERGLEVYMLKRSSAAVFSPRAHVFPGGRVDDADRDATACEWCAPLSAASDVPGAFYVAALREAFEEAGLLLAYDRSGSVIRLDDPGTSERFGLHRKAIHAGELGIGSLCREEGLTLAVDLLVPFAHWITPKGPPRRFDTRFFAARAPEWQHATHDGAETTEGLWTRPTDLLSAFAAGSVELITPTRHSLERFADFGAVDDALQGLELAS
ncbi:MAG TPA: hypothetical protein VGZ52_12055 [Acidimicrobiales bacterium]|nr:hypothetical protein [Acidimicrobiales bacterium]